MAITGSREIVIEAPKSVVIDVIADVEALPSWSPVYKKVAVLSRHSDGRPKQIEATVGVAGITDTVVLEYTFEESVVTWTLISASQQKSQDAVYTLTESPSGTHVRFDLSIDLVIPVPGFIVKRGTKTLLDNATEGLRVQATG